LADQAPKLIEAMLSAGLDRYAARWLSVVSEAGDDLSWGYLAVASPRPISGVTASRIQDFGSASENDGDLRARMLFAGLAALGHAPGAVAILCAVGLQADNWSDIPPEHLYHIVSALRRVGLEPEARMIAAEAVTRA
jgi:hypothetical protein